MSQLLICNVYLFSLSNMKKISNFLQFSSGNVVTGVTFILALHQWGKFSKGQEIIWLKMLCKTNIGLAELMNNETIKEWIHLFHF